MVLVEAELTDFGTVGIHAAEIRHRVAATDTWHAVKATGRTEHDAPIGQIAGVVVVDIRFVTGCHLAQPAAVRPHLENLPTIVRADRGKEQSSGIRMQIHVAYKSAVGRFQERRPPYAGAPR